MTGDTFNFLIGPVAALIMGLALAVYARWAARRDMEREPQNKTDQGD